MTILAVSRQDTSKVLIRLLQFTVYVLYTCVNFRLVSLISKMVYRKRGILAPGLVSVLRKEVSLSEGKGICEGISE